VNTILNSNRFDVEVKGLFDEEGFRMMLRLLKDFGSVRQTSFDAQSNAPVALAKFVVFTMHDAESIRGVLSQVSRNAEVKVEASHA